jgi:hypothetical protein
MQNALAVDARAFRFVIAFTSEVDTGSREENASKINDSISGE